MNTLPRSINFLRPFANGQFQQLFENRTFYFLGTKKQADIFQALPEIRKSTEPINDYFTKHGEVGKVGKMILFSHDNSGSEKMISLPKPPPSQKPSWQVPSLEPKLPSQSTRISQQTHKRVKISSNRSGRIIVKPIRIPLVIDIQKMIQEPQRIYMPTLPPPIPLTLKQKFVNLSKDAAWVAFGAMKRKSLEQVKKIEMPKLDAQKTKKIVIFGSPLVTALIGYIYGKSD